MFLVFSITYSCLEKVGMQVLQFIEICSAVFKLIMYNTLPYYLYLFKSRE